MARKSEQLSFEDCLRKSFDSLTSRHVKQTIDQFPPQRGVATATYARPNANPGEVTIGSTTSAWDVVGLSSTVGNLSSQS